MPEDAVYILGSARTPIGAFQGSLASVSAPQLGACAIRAALQRSGVESARVDETYLGQVLTAGVGQAPARQAARAAGVGDHAPATTVGKVCGSGLQALILGAKSIRLGDASLVVAGGMESMSNAPYLAGKARHGYRLGHGRLVDSLVHDGLWDPYHDFHMANAAEACARELGISRDAQDAFARRSYERAQRAQQEGSFAEEIEAVEVRSRRGTNLVRDDEEPQRARLDSLADLSPAFEASGSITAGNASKIDDGAAALVLAGERVAQRHGWVPTARVVAYAGHADAPERFPTAPIAAMEKVLVRAGLNHRDIDLYEINEAFAVVTLACMQGPELDSERINVRGGAVALGHPIGASGARIVVTLVHALRARGGRYGLATLCIGGGEALALIVEAV